MTNPEKLLPCDTEAAVEWARKVSQSRPPRYTDASRNAAAFILNTRTLADRAGLVGELEEWADIANDPDAIVKCGERWKDVAATIGCTLMGFSDGKSASFTTPDGNVIQIGPKLRRILAALPPTQEAGREG